MSKKNGYTQGEMMKEMREVHSPYVKNNKSYSQAEAIKDVGTVGNNSSSPLQKIKEAGRKELKKKAKRYSDLLY